jgi:RNA polymerase sigma factor (sigma-70 family)
MRVLENPADAEEASQATFIALAMKARTLDASAGLGGWLHRVARQAAIDLRRSAQRRQLRQEEMTTERVLLQSTQRSSGSDERWLEELDEAIDTLPRKLRTTIIGHYLEGRSVEDLAQSEACSVSAVTMRLARGRESLRKLLEKRGFGRAVVLGLALQQSARVATAMGVHFTADTLRAVKAAMAGVAAMEGVPAGGIELARNVLRQLFMQKMRWAFATGTAAVVLASAGLGVRAWAAAGESNATPVAASPSPAVTLATGTMSTPLNMPARTPKPQDPPLIAAIKHKHFGFEGLPAFEKLVNESKGKLNELRDANGLTALHCAVKRGWQDEATLLLMRGADVNATDNMGRTPLFYAVSRGDIWMDRLLVVAGAHMQVISKDGQTPLTAAIHKKEMDQIELLLWLGSKLHLDGVPDANQPLAMAQASGDEQIQQLVESYANLTNPTFQEKPRHIPTFVKNALQEAARVGDYEKLDSFLNQGANIDLPDDQGRTALFSALDAGRGEVVFYLLMLGANPNIADKKGTTPIMHTMGWLGGGLDSMRRYLILKGASPFALRQDKFNALTWAIERDNETSVQWMLWLGANGREPTERGTPFQIAFEGGHQRIMDLLRRNGIDEPVKLHDDPVWNLFNGVKRGDIPLVTAVLDQGVAVDSLDKDGSTPLIVAIATRNLRVARFLIERGANINFRNAKSGNSPLYQTMCWDYPDMTDFREDLLKAGVDPDTALNNGKTALMRGIWFHPTKPMKQLLEYGADLNKRDKEGITALGHALKDGKTQTAEYLRQLGATE